MLNALIVATALTFAADLPAPSVTIDVKDGIRTITANGMPNHATGQFPGPHNPNTIAAQKYTFTMPAEPKIAEKFTLLPRGPFGIAVNGILFDPSTAEMWRNDQRSGWNIEAIPPAGVNSMNLGLDSSNAHVQPNGAYHYHSSPLGLITKLAEAQNAKPERAMVLVGWAADGFPIYDRTAPTDAQDAASPLRVMKSSYRLKSGQRPGSTDTPPGPGGAYDGTYTQDYEFVQGLGDLDEANGRTGPTPEFPGGTYYYVITESFPYIPREFRGTPDASFQRRGPQGGGRGPGGPGGGGPGGPEGRPRRPRPQG